MEVDEILKSIQYSMRNRPSRTSKNTKFQVLLVTKSFLLQRPRTCSPVYYSSPSRWRSCLQCMLRNFFQTTRAAWDMRLGVAVSIAKTTSRNLSFSNTLLSNLDDQNAELNQLPLKQEWMESHIYSERDGRNKTSRRNVKMGIFFQFQGFWPPHSVACFSRCSGAFQKVSWRDCTWHCRAKWQPFKLHK